MREARRSARVSGSGGRGVQASGRVSPFACVFRVVAAVPVPLPGAPACPPAAWSHRSLLLPARPPSELAPLSYCQFAERKAITGYSFNLHFPMTRDFENLFHMFVGL